MTNTSSGVNACDGCERTSSSIDFDIAIRVGAPDVCASAGSAMWKENGTGSSSYNCVNNSQREHPDLDPCRDANARNVDGAKHRTTLSILCATCGLSIVQTSKKNCHENSHRLNISPHTIVSEDAGTQLQRVCASEDRARK